MIVKEILSSTDFLYKYTIKGEDVGFLEIRIVDNIIDIMDLFVKDDYRKKGIATSLMNYVIENEAHTKIMLEVNENNLAAIKLYNKLGFEEISIRERYYSDGSALIMQRYKRS